MLCSKPSILTMPDGVPAYKVRTKKLLSDSMPENVARPIKSLRVVAEKTPTQNVIVSKLGIHCSPSPLGSLNNISAE